MGARSSSWHDLSGSRASSGTSSIFQLTVVLLPRDPSMVAVCGAGAVSRYALSLICRSQPASDINKVRPSLRGHLNHEDHSVSVFAGQSSRQDGVDSPVNRRDMLSIIAQ
jgi:hypothetical protein